MGQTQDCLVICLEVQLPSQFPFLFRPRAPNIDHDRPHHCNPSLMLGPVQHVYPIYGTRKTC